MKSDLFIPLTLLLWGIIPILDKRGLTGENVLPFTGMAIRLISAFFALILILSFSGGLRNELKNVSGKVVLIFATSGIISMIVSQLLYYEALKDRSVGRLFPILFGGAPVAGMLFAAIFLGEKITVSAAVGCLLISLGSVLMFF